ncbi:hypothetical protein [Devosia sp.]|uniref:hypothetical protein n=1 Tax=Devosia sp. TaxID=1871048 RepID=UPI001AD17754|nr:hypothetical protein [Devosia sp.]MBN9307905.1 hypothetical protein [Devosia sp.]
MTDPMTPSPLVYLHCGFHKTGTTSLQALLARNLGHMPEGSMSLVHSHPLVRQFGTAAKAYDRKPSKTTTAGLIAAWARLLAEVRAHGAGRVIISTENTFGRIPTIRRGTVTPYPRAGEILSLLNSVSDGIELRPIVYVREDDAWTASLHRHLVRTRAFSLSLASFQSAFVGFEAGLLGIAHRISREAGTAVEILSFERDLPHRLGIGSSLLALAGLSDESLAPWQPVPRRNEGASDDLVRFVTTPPIANLPRPLRYASLRIRAKVKGSRLA